MSGGARLHHGRLMSPHICVRNPTLCVQAPADTMEGLQHSDEASHLLGLRRSHHGVLELALHLVRALHLFLVLLLRRISLHGVALRARLLGLHGAAGTGTAGVYQPSVERANYFLLHVS